MQVETALRIFAGVAQLEQIEDRLDICVEPIVTLSRKRNVSIRQFSD
jgi:hypothetical protein